MALPTIGNPDYLSGHGHRSSVVELSIRNRAVVGSNPTGGSEKKLLWRMVKEGGGWLRAAALDSPPYMWRLTSRMSSFALLFLSLILLLSLRLLRGGSEAREVTIC